MSSSRPTVIVTGSSGLIGQPICARLDEAGYEVYGLDLYDLPESLKRSGHVHHVECDITDDVNVRDAVEQVKQACGGKLASVVHLAAYYDFGGEESELYEKVTVNGTDRLLKSLADWQVEQFVFTSTMLVHAPCEIGEHISEQDPLVAKWPYPQSKIDTEHLIRDGHPGVHSVFLRIAGVYNDTGQQPTLVQQIKRIYERDFQSIFFPGDPRAGQSMVHVDDVVDAVIRTVDRRSDIPPQTPILIGEPDPVSYEDLQDVIGNLVHGKEWATLYVPPKVAKVGAAVSDTLSSGGEFIKPYMIELADDHYALDITRANELLGWQPQHSLVQAIPGMIDSLRQDPQAWYRSNGLDS
jgi:UDP-glucose 4-epimerase